MSDPVSRDEYLNQLLSRFPVFNQPTSHIMNSSVPPPNSRLWEYTFPSFLLGISLIKLPQTTLKILFSRPFDLLFFNRWSDEWFHQIWQLVSLKEQPEEKRLTASGAKGTVIELGPGFGPSLEFYDKSRVSHIYLVEPNYSLHDRLRESIEKYGWQAKTTIVACGIEDDAGLSRAGVPKAGVDTVVSIQVLCSVPTPETIIPALYRRLKSGGELRIYEHILSHEETTRKLQKIYDFVWPYPFGGCRLVRPTDKLLVDEEFMGFSGTSSGWRDVVLDKVKGESKYSCIPCFYGVLTKA